MKKSTEKILALFVNLPGEERKEAVSELAKFLASDASAQQNISESMKKQAGVPLGPMDSGGCPYCGK